MKKGIVLLLTIILLTACTVYDKEEKRPIPKAEPEPEAEFRCEDSDGGYEPGMKGIVNKFVNDDKSVLEDKCKDEFKLTEIYCEGNIVKTKEVQCSFGCHEGKCLTEEEKQELEKQKELEKQLEEEIEKQYQKEEMEKELEEQQKKEEEEREQERKAVQDEFYNCFNGFKDSFETDTDCGGLCEKGCGFGKACKEDNDCAQGLFCNVRSKKCSNLRH